MAIKGLVDLDAYEIGTYFTPEDYVIPPRSVGDFVVGDYVVVDYLLEGLDLTSTATLSCDADLLRERASLTSEFTITSLAGLAIFATKTITAVATTSAQMSRTRSSPASLTTQASLQSPGGLILRSTASVSTNASVSVDGNVLFGAQAQAQSSATTEQNGNLIVGGFTTFDAVSTNISVGGVIYDIMAQQDDYTWDEFAESEFIDRTWNEWYGGRWHPGLIAYTVGTILQANGGLTASGSGTYTAVVSTSIPVAGRIRSTLFESTPQSEFTIDGNGNVIFDNTKSLLSQFTQQQDYIRFRNPGAKTLQTQFNSQQNANQIFDQSTTQSYGIAFNSSQNANAVFRSSKSLDSVISFTSNGNVLFGGEVFDLQFFYSTLQFARLITLPDSWNTVKVNKEIRTIVLPIESRSLPVNQETRVNSITIETRSIKVPQETRRFKIFKPQFTNRSSIPRVRQET